MNENRGRAEKTREREAREERETCSLSLFPQHFFLQKHSPQASSILIKFLSQAYSLLNFSRHLSLLPFYTNIMSLPPSSLSYLFLSFSSHFPHNFSFHLSFFLLPLNLYLSLSALIYIPIYLSTFPSHLNLCFSLCLPAFFSTAESSLLELLPLFHYH